jgi:hypothetical protein
MFLRYRVSNLILWSVLPGPREQDTDQLQNYLHVAVNELLRLWLDGFLAVTHDYPHGRRVRVALVGVFCDKLAAHKLGGFASHSHRFPCTICWITKDDLASKKSFEKDGMYFIILTLLNYFTNYSSSRL